MIKIFYKLPKRMFSNTVTTTVASSRSNNQAQLFIRLRNPEPAPIVEQQNFVASQTTEILASPANVQNLVAENRDVLVTQQHFLQESINSQIQNSHSAELFVQNIYNNLNSPLRILNHSEIDANSLSTEINHFNTAFYRGMQNMHSIATAEPLRIEEFRARLAEAPIISYDFSNLLVNAPQPVHLNGVDLFSHFFSFFGLEALTIIENIIQSNPSLAYPIFLYTFSRLFAHFGSSGFFRINSQNRLNAFIREQISFAIVRLRNTLTINVSSSNFRTIIDQSVINLNNDYASIIARANSAHNRARLYNIVLGVLPLLYTQRDSIAGIFQAFREIFFTHPNAFRPRITNEMANSLTLGQLVDIIVRFIARRAKYFLK